MVLLALMLTGAGSLLLCLSMNKHWKQLLPARAYRSRARPWLRAGGYTALVIALWLSIEARGGVIGSALFCGFLTAAVVAIALALPYLHRGPGTHRNDSGDPGDYA
jgi:hypothetical protein